MLTEIPSQEDGLRSRGPFPKDQSVVRSPLNSEGLVAQCEAIKGPFRLLQLCQALCKPLVSEDMTDRERKIEIYREKRHNKDIMVSSSISHPSMIQCSATSDSCSQFTQRDHSNSAFSVSFASQRKLILKLFCAEDPANESQVQRYTHGSFQEKFVVHTSANTHSD